MIKNEKFIWRIIAIICTLVWTIVLFAVNAFTPKIVYHGIVTLSHNNILYGFSIVISLLLIFFPLQFYLYATMFWAWGLATLVVHTGPNAILVYLLGCAFAYPKFSVKYGSKKCLLLLLPLIIVIAFQYRLGVDVLVSSLTDFLFLAMVFVLLYVLLVHPLVEKIKALPSDSIIIKNCKLSEEELALLDAVLHERPYKAIVNNTEISESAIKQRIKSLIGKIGAENRGNLLALHKHGKIIFPD